MHQILAGVLVGVAAVLFGPRLLSDIAVTLQPAGKGLLHLSETAVGMVSSSVSAAGNWVGELVGSGTKTAHPSSQSPGPKSTIDKKSESDKKEESFLQEAEEFGKDMVVNLAEEEAMTFIKMALIAII